MEPRGNRAVPDRRDAGSRSPNDIHLVVGQNIGRWRQSKCLTLLERAAAFGIIHQQLQYYETGTDRPSTGMMPGVAEILGVDIAHLFENAVAKASDHEADRLRAECGQVLRRPSSPELLKSMPRVLKTLAPR